MMNKLMRNPVRIPNELWTEIELYFFQDYAIEDENSRKLPKLPEHERVTSAKYVWTGLTISFTCAYKIASLFYMACFLMPFTFCHM
jgi:hypothetical protein